MDRPARRAGHRAGRVVERRVYRRRRRLGRERARGWRDRARCRGEGVLGAHADRAADVPRGADVAPDEPARHRVRYQRAALLRELVPARRTDAEQGQAMKLRGRFTVTLALAALVPITVAAVVTVRVISETYRGRYVADRKDAAETLERELERMKKGVRETAISLAAHDHPLVGDMLIDYAKGNGELDLAAQHKLRERAGSYMHGLSLELLTITGPDDVVQVAPHYRAKIGEVDKTIREVATAHAGSAYYAI